MTLVHFDLADPAGDPLAGYVSLVPTRRVTVGDEIRMPTALRVRLESGEASVELMPSTTQWVWRVSELVPGGITRYVAVPDSDTVVEYAALEDVDPASLDVSSASVSAWEIATRTAQEALDKVGEVDGQVELAERAARDAQAALDEAKRFDLTVGTVSDLPYGQHATAIVRGEWPIKTVDFQLVTGPQGRTGDTGPRGVQGPQGVQGEKGEPFSIAKVYASVSVMRSDPSDDVEPGQFVMISTGSVDDPENACLYVRVEGEQPDCWSFVTDMSGATGIQGPQGVQGIQGPPGKDGERGPEGRAATITVDRSVTVSDTEMGVANTGSESDAVLHFTLQRGPQGVQGEKGDPGENGFRILTAATLEEGLELSASNPTDLVLVVEEGASS